MGATKYHISTNGQVATCRAEIKCRLTDISGEGKAKHFESKQEAQAYAEKAMSEKHNVTKSAEKKKAPRAGKKATFSIPPAVKTEGYMGAGGYAGGNYLRLMAEGGASHEAYNTKVIAGELRKDIKQAIKAGVLPQDLDGKKVSYRVNAPSGRGVSAVDVIVSVDESTLDYEPRLENRAFGRWGASVKMQSTAEEKLSATTEKLEEMVNSYNFDESNAMVDYFHRNFYGKVKVRTNGGDFESAAKSEKKAIKSVVDTFVDGKESVDFSKPYTDSEKVAIIDRAMKNNPEARKAVEQWVNNENEYNLSRDTESIAYAESHEINEQEQSMKIKYDEAVGRRNELIEKIKIYSLGQSINFSVMKNKNSNAAGFKDMNFHTPNYEAGKNVNSRNEYMHERFARNVFSSMENRGVREKTRSRRGFYF